MPVQFVSYSFWSFHHTAPTVLLYCKIIPFLFELCIFLRRSFRTMSSLSPTFYLFICIEGYGLLLYSVPYHLLSHIWCSNILWLRQYESFWALFSFYRFLSFYKHFLTARCYKLIWQLSYHIPWSTHCSKALWFE